MTGSARSNGTSVAAAAEAAETPQRPTIKGALAGRRILLVEDGPDNQVLIMQILKIAGAHSVLAEDGVEAVTKGLEGGIELILMDIQLPRMDGYEATRRLRASGFKKPILALTAHAMQGERERCFAAGCDEFLTKPVSTRSLIETIALLMKKEPTSMTKHNDTNEKQPRSGSETPTPLPSLFADDPVISEIISGFVDRLPQRVLDLESKLALDDWQGIGQTAHQLKGAAGGYGYPELASLAEAIGEQAKTQREPQDLRRLIDELKQFVQRAQAALGE